MFDDSGAQLDATFHIEIASPREASLVFESRGGKPPRNVDYNRALTLVLRRLGRAHATLVRVELDTAETRELPAADRLVVIDEAPYDIELRGRDDYEQLRVGLGRGAGRICQSGPGAGTKGGNTQRQVRLHLRFPEGHSLSKSWLEATLGNPPQPGQPFTYTQPNVEGSVAEEDVFVPTYDDTRPRAQREVTTRPGQPAFRARLIECYGPRCVVSGCEVLEALEAAHISGYRGESDNHRSNGVLLRADLHKLFDANLLAIHPVDLVVHIKARAAIGEYSQYVGRPLLGRPLLLERLSNVALHNRWKSFTEDDASETSE